MDIIFKTKSGKEFSLVANEDNDKMFQEINSAIIVADKMGDNVTSIHNGYMTMPYPTKALALGWRFENWEFSRQPNY